MADKIFDTEQFAKVAREAGISPIELIGDVSPVGS